MPIAQGPHLTPMLKIRADQETVMVRRVGRFSIEAEAAKSPVHLGEGQRRAWRAMVEGLKHHPDGAYEYVEHPGPGAAFTGYVVKGPLPHMESSLDVTPDLGGADQPDPRDTDATARYERAERGRVARKLHLAGSHGMVDFTITAHFLRRMSPGHRIHLPYQHEAKAILRGERAFAAGAAKLATARH